MDLPEAIRRMTTLAASAVGIEKRGELREGYYADVVVMDWANLQVRHDYLKPRDSVDGIKYVFVNGTLCVENRHVSNAASGRMLRKQNQ